MAKQVNIKSNVLLIKSSDMDSAPLEVTIVPGAYSILKDELGVHIELQDDQIVADEARNIGEVFTPNGMIPLKAGTFRANINAPRYGRYIIDGGYNDKLDAFVVIEIKFPDAITQLEQSIDEFRTFYELNAPLTNSLVAGIQCKVDDALKSLDNTYPRQ